MKEELKNCLQELIVSHYRYIQYNQQYDENYKNALKLIKKAKLKQGNYIIDNELLRIYLRGSTEKVKPIWLIDFLGKPKEII